ncbi:MAG: ClpXP adapter SpxH family protein [Bacillus sp. (in: firmicutes)]
MSSQNSVFNFYDWLHSYHCSVLGKKPIEIYVFTDPLCYQCWKMEPILKRLQMEYGAVVSIKHILSGKLEPVTKQPQFPSTRNLAHIRKKTASRSEVTCDGNAPIDEALTLRYNISIAIKAAELQGKKYGNRFLRKLQEFHFLKNKNISERSVLLECAQAANIDCQEFLNDINSHLAAKAFQCDLKVTAEMGVQETPSIVFFNDNIEDEGIRVSGMYSYDVYLSILSEMMPSLPEPAELPEIEHFVRFFNVVSTKEIAFTYEMKEDAVELIMKKLMLRRIVHRFITEEGTFWKYIAD